jgi:hypothetical protein
MFPIALLSWIFIDFDLFILCDIALEVSYVVYHSVHFVSIVYFFFFHCFSFRFLSVFLTFQCNWRWNCAASINLRFNWNISLVFSFQFVFFPSLLFHNFICFCYNFFSSAIDLLYFIQITPRKRSNLGRRTRGAEAVRRVIANQTEERAKQTKNGPNTCEEAAQRRAARLEDARLRARRSRSAASDLLRSQQNDFHCLITSAI